MLASSFYPGVSIASLLSYLFPEHVQAYFTNVLEPAFTTNAKSLKAVKVAVPAPIAVMSIACFDGVLASGFVVYSLATNYKVTPG